MLLLTRFDMVILEAIQSSLNLNRLHMYNRRAVKYTKYNVK